MDGNDQDAVRLAATPGVGWLARRATSLLFIPSDDQGRTPPGAARLAARFVADGPSAELAADPLPRCLLEWTESGDVVRVVSTFELIETLSLGPGTPRVEFKRIPPGVGEVRRDPDRAHAIVSDLDCGGFESAGDLRDGDAPAGGFVLVLPTPSRTAPEAGTASRSARAEVTAEPEQFEELTDLDVTLTPVGPITYPDDDTDRTFRRAGDVRCPRGHANPSTHDRCRVCGDSLDATAGRSGPRPSTAIAGLRLPDGTVIPINRSIAVGRSPSTEGAGLESAPRLVAIEAPGTVSRTHVLLRLDAGIVTATDCGARGRTAVTPTGGGVPVALEPWQPRRVEIGDTIQLGGPTTLTITDPAELRVPPGLEPTAPPPERNETQ